MAGVFLTSIFCVVPESSGSSNTSLVSRPHFSRPLEKWVWSTAYSIFVQVRRNVGALFFSNWGERERAPI